MKFICIWAFPEASGRSPACAFCPMTRGNLAVAAAVAFRQATGQSWTDLRISIEKRIPVCAGHRRREQRRRRRSPGAQSPHQRGLSLQDLARIGAAVGSDVPYCVLGGTALAQGRGETLTPLPALPACLFVLCKPRFSISTPALFREWDKKRRHLRPDTKGTLAALAQGDLLGIARRTFNVFEGVLPPHQHREIEAIKHTMIQAGALGAAMSGSGPTVFGIFSQAPQAQEAWAQLREDYDEVFLAEPLVQNSIP